MQRWTVVEKGGEKKWEKKKWRSFNCRTGLGLVSLSDILLEHIKNTSFQTRSLIVFSEDEMVTLERTAQQYVRQCSDPLLEILRLLIVSQIEQIHTIPVVAVYVSDDPVGVHYTRLPNSQLALHFLGR